MAVVGVPEWPMSLSMYCYFSWTYMDAQFAIVGRLNLPSLMILVLYSAFSWKTVLCVSGAQY